MPFEKLNEHFEHTFAGAGIETPNELQEKIMARTKQGGDLLVIAPEKSGKTIAAALSVFQKVPESYEGSPRAIVITGSADKTKSLAALISNVTRRRELSVEMAHEKGPMIEQRNNIFDGADIIIGTAGRIYDLYIQNGINLGMLKLFIIDDANDMLKEATLIQIRRLAGSLPKCQRMVLASSVTPKLEKMLEEILVNEMVLEA